MKKLFAVIFLMLIYTQSFAFNILQTTIETQDAPPAPGISPFGAGDPGTPEDQTPINFIVPFLIISVIALSVYIVRKNKTKTI